MNWTYAHWVNAVFLRTILGCFLLHLIHGSDFPASTHFSEVADFAAFFACLPICWALSWGMAATIVSAYLFCRCLCLHVSRTGLVHVFFFTIFTLSNFFASVRLFMMEDWVLLINLADVYMCIYCCLPSALFSVLYISVHAYMYSGDAIYWNIYGLLICHWLYHGRCGSCIEQIFFIFATQLWGLAASHLIPTPSLHDGDGSSFPGFVPSSDTFDFKSV